MSEKRCSLCGAERINGACSLLGCRDPLFDQREEDKIAAAEERGRIHGQRLDSDAREVLPAKIRPCWHMTIRHLVGTPPELWCEKCGRWRAVEEPTGEISLHLPLAQRILAALEEAESPSNREVRALAAELRALLVTHG